MMIYLKDHVKGQIRETPEPEGHIELRRACQAAGNAVIARILKISVERVTLEGMAINWRTRKSNRLGGAAYTEAEWLEAREPLCTKNGGCILPSYRAVHAHIITILAGTAAIKECGGMAAKGREVNIKAMLQYLYSDDPRSLHLRLRKMAHMLVRRHRARIERVVNYLLHVGPLTSGQLDQVIALEPAQRRIQGSAV